MSEPGYIPITLLYAPLKGLSPLVESVVITHESPTPLDRSRPKLMRLGACYVTVTLANGFALKHVLDPVALRLPERVEVETLNHLINLLNELIATIERIEREK